MWARVAAVLCGSAMLVLAVGERTVPAPEEQETTVQVDLDLHDASNADTDPVPGFVLVDEETQPSNGP